MNYFSQHFRELRGHKTQHTFADELGVQVNSIRKYEGKDKSNPTLDVLIKLVSLTGISLDWLVYNKGNKFGGTQEKAPPHSQVGTRLQIAIDYKKITKDEIIQKTQISANELDSVLDNNEYPTFSFIQKMYEEFALNPSYLLTGNEFDMFEARTDLERVKKLADFREEQQVNTRTLCSWFGCTKDEASEWLKEYKEYGVRLPYEWLSYFVKQLQFNQGWITEPKNRQIAFFIEELKQRQPDDFFAVEKNNTTVESESV